MDFVRFGLNWIFINVNKANDERVSPESSLSLFERDCFHRESEEVSNAKHTHIEHIYIYIRVCYTYVLYRIYIVYLYKIACTTYIIYHI